MVGIQGKLQTQGIKRDKTQYFATFVSKMETNLAFFEYLLHQLVEWKVSSLQHKIYSTISNILHDSKVLNDPPVVTP
jgi:hypothetical protein